MVMLIFLKKFYRDLRESKGQFISVLAVVIIGVMFYTALHSALEGLSGAGRRYFEEYRLGDLWGSLYRAPEEVVKRIDRIPGVKMVTGRVVRNVRISMEKRDAMVRLVSLPDKKTKVVNDIQLKSGSYFSEDAGNQCIVSEAVPYPCSGAVPPFSPSGLFPHLPSESIRCLRCLLPFAPYT
jgi:putative ABC transport system permease protein